MKRLILAAAVLTLAGTLARAQVTQVVSRNAVGYVKLTVLSNNLFMGSMPFYEVGDDGEYTIGEIFGDQLNGGPSFALSDNVLKFDPVSSVYITFWKTLTGEWRQVPEGTVTTNTLSPGEAFFIRNRKNTNQVVYLLGEVPDRFTVADDTQKVDIVEGLQFVSYSYPTEIGINDTTLANNAHRGPSFALADNVIAWEATSRVYRTYWLPLSGGWRKVPEGVDTSDKLVPGQGVFYRRRAGFGAFTWDEAKPYTWP